MAFCLDRGGMNTHITDLFLFDALYGNVEFYRAWLRRLKGRCRGLYRASGRRAHAVRAIAR